MVNSNNNRVIDELLTIEEFAAFAIERALDTNRCVVTNIKGVEASRFLIDSNGVLQNNEGMTAREMSDFKNSSTRFSRCNVLTCDKQ